MWWEAEASGPDELAGSIGKGLYRCVDGAKRYRFDHYRRPNPKWFDINGTITGADVTTLPASDQPPNYPCEGCPSAAG